MKFFLDASIRHTVCISRLCPIYVICKLTLGKTRERVVLKLHLDIQEIIPLVDLWPEPQTQNRRKAGKKTTIGDLAALWDLLSGIVEFCPSARTRRRGGVSAVPTAAGTRLCLRLEVDPLGLRLGADWRRGGGG